MALAHVKLEVYKGTQTNRQVIQSDKYFSRSETKAWEHRGEKGGMTVLKRGRNISLLLLASFPRCYHCLFFFFLSLESHRPQVISANLVDSQSHSQLEVIIFLPFLSGKSIHYIIFAKPSFTPCLPWPPSHHMTNGFLFIGTQVYCLSGTRI